MMKYSLYFIGSLFLLLISLYLIAFIYLKTADSQEAINTTFSFTGTFGDSINGLFAPVIGVLAVITTFLAFVVQFEANQQIRIDTRFERFETKFFELLRLHKENVNEINLAGTVSGRKAFVRMYYEFEFLFYLVKGVYNQGKEQGEDVGDLNDDDFLLIAYNYFFYGFGENSSMFLEMEILAKYSAGLYKAINQSLSSKQDAFEGRRKAKNYNGDPIKLLANDGEGTKSYICDFFYFPFDGHVTKLAHYYRHLFQTVKYVVNQDLKILSDSQKREYLKTLRAQLSNHEQLMLYYNSITGAGKDWISNNYFTKWKMIKNIQLPLLDKGTNIYERLGMSKEEADKQDVFEWKINNDKKDA